MKRRHVNLLTVFVMLLMGVGCARELVDPAPIATRGKDQTQVKAAIMTGLKNFGWRVSSDDPGKIVAVYTRGRHAATISLTYDAQAIMIKYVDSRELKYEVREGTRYIHRRYNDWVQNLANHIDFELSTKSGGALGSPIGRVEIHVEKLAVNTR